MKKIFKNPVTGFIVIVLALSIMASTAVGIFIVSGRLNNSFFLKKHSVSNTVNDNKPSYPEPPNYNDPDSPWVKPTDNNDNNSNNSSNSNNGSNGDNSDNNENTNKPVTELSADITDVFHDQGTIYMDPIKPTKNDRVTIRIRVKKQNVSWCYIHLSRDYGKSWIKYPLKYYALQKNDNYEDWAIIIPKQIKDYYYFFTLGNEKQETKYYGIYGIQDEKIDSFNKCFFVRVDSKVPEWSYGQYWYSINTNAFFNKDPLNDPSGQYVDLSPGQQMNDNHYRSMFGGDIQGINEKLDYINSLHINNVYMNPIMPSWDAAGYGWLDSYSISSRNGNEESLSLLSKKLHNNNGRIMLDYVVALWPGNSIWANDKNYNIYPFEGALTSKSSRYFDMFHFNMWPSDYLKRFASIAPDFSGENAKKAIYSNKDSLIQRYLSPEFKTDAVRFDSSIYIWGSDTPKEKIVSEMAGVAKSLNKDYLFAGENDNFRYYDWDSTWNLKYTDSLRAVAQFQTSLSNYQKNAIKYMQSLSRPMALSTYVYIDNIDKNRIRTTIDKQWLLNSCTLLQMTYIGSPSLRFGNETASESTMSHRLNSFDWDESTWNYENLNFIKALGKLREDYQCLKTGVVKFGEVEDNEQFLTLGRWDNKSTVITAINRTEEIVNRKIEVSQFGLKDGEILTDYFTGAKYKIENGYINADIIPGGTVFVNDGKSSVSRFNYTITDFSSNKNSVVALNYNSFKFNSANGSVSGTADKNVSLALTPVFGSVKIDGNVKTSGAAGLSLRNSEKDNGIAYNAVVNNGKLTVSARKKNNAKSEIITTCNVPDNSTISIIRNEYNVFMVAVNNNILNDSACKIQMNNKIFAGMVALDGETLLSNVSISNDNTKYYTDFENGLVSSLFDVTGKYNISNSVLKLESSTSTPAYCFASVPQGDWTSKTLLKNSNLKDNAVSGILAYSSKSNAIFGGRTVIDGKKKVVLGRFVNDELVVYGNVPDTYNELEIQLQKTGNYFTLLYREKNTEWKQIDSRVFSSINNPKVGVYLNGNKTSVDINYITFGNMINGGTSINTPQNINRKDNSFKDTSLSFPSWKIVGDENNWDYVGGGISQLSKEVDEYLYDTRSTHTDFRAEGTIQFKSKTGYVSMLLRKPNADKKKNDGYSIKINNDGKMQLFYNDTLLKSKNVTIPSMGLRVAVDCSGSTIAVYYGTDLKLAFYINDAKQNEGYFGINTCKEKAIIGNMDIFTNEENTWMNTSSSYPALNIFQRTDNSLKIDVNNNLAVTSQKGIAYTNFEASVSINAKQDVSGFAGFGFSQSEGVAKLSTGVYVALRGDNKLVILKDGVEVKSINVSSNDCKLKVNVKDGIIKAYINDRFMLEWKDENYSGGVLNLVGNNTSATFENFNVKNLE